MTRGKAPPGGSENRLVLFRALHFFSFGLTVFLQSNHEMHEVFMEYANLAVVQSAINESEGWARIKMLPSVDAACSSAVECRVPRRLKIRGG